MDIQEMKNFRKEIDIIDEKLIKLFQRRMEISREIGKYKRLHKIPVLDASREAEKLKKVSELADKNMEEYCLILYNKIMELSRDYQNKIQPLYPEADFDVLGLNSADIDLLIRVCF